MARKACLSDSVFVKVNQTTKNIETASAMLSKDMYVLLHGSIFLKNESVLNCSKGEKKKQPTSRIDFTWALLVTPIHTSAIFFPW